MAQGNRRGHSHRLDDQLPSRPEVERGRPPNLNQTCRGHGDQNKSGQCGGESKKPDPGGFTDLTMTTTPIGSPFKDSAYHDSTSNDANTIKGQEGVEREPMEVYTTQTASTPPERCMCLCTCVNCLCNRNENHLRYEFTREDSPARSYTDSPPPSLMTEDEHMFDSASPGQASRTSSNLSDVLHGAGDWHHEGLPPHFVQTPLALTEGIPRYPDSLSGSEFDGYDA